MNQIIYDRNGRHLLDSTKIDPNYTFTLKDLQRILETGLHSSGRKKETWIWAFIQPNKLLKPYYIPFDNKDETLLFESRFEGGNLETVVKISNNEYNLILQHDALTNGNTQWFYFKISNIRKGNNVTFRVINFVI